MLESIQQALERGFNREAQAIERYVLFAHKAEEEAKTATTEAESKLLKEAAELFLKIAEDESDHAHQYLMSLDGISETVNNLKTAMDLEENDTVEYSISAAAARSNDLEDIAQKFERIGAAEKRHFAQLEKITLRLQETWMNKRLNQI
jgi:rubrerythrin